MSYLSGNSDSLADRLDSLVYQLETNATRFLGSVIDLENKLAKLNPPQPAYTQWPKTITFEEFADEDGDLNDQKIEESVWLESLTRETGLDCRMILDFKPLKNLGCIRWYVVVNQKGKPVTYDFQVWIVPVGDAK